MPLAITGINKFIAEIETEVEISGTAFTAAPTVKIGLTLLTAIEVTADITKTDTKITMKLPSTAKLGNQNIYVSVTISTVTTTVSIGVYIVSPDDYDNSELKLGLLGKLYLNGQHVGNCEGQVSINLSSENKDYKPNHSRVVEHTFIVSTSCQVKFDLSQINPKNLAMATGASLDSTGRIVTIKSQVMKEGVTPGTYVEGIEEYSFAFFDASGVSYFIPRAQIIEPSNILLSQSDNMTLPITLRALDDASGTVCVITFP